MLLPSVSKVPLVKMFSVSLFKSFLMVSTVSKGAFLMLYDNTKLYNSIPDETKFHVLLNEFVFSLILFDT